MKKPAAVVLDGYTLNPGDLSWDGLKAICACTIHDRTAPEQIVERARDAEILFTNKVPLDRATLAALPRLRYIGVLATGYNVVDVAAARERGIPVANVPDYGTPAVAQNVFAHLLNFTNHVAAHDASVHRGEWARCPDFCYWLSPLVELEGQTFGLVGYGRIGQAVAQIARAFGMNVVAHTRSHASLDAAAEWVELDELFRLSDVISLHCPLTEATRGLINATRLALMKPSAFLINTGRGPLVDEVALAAALNEGRIAGAGLDVLSIEPPRADNPLLAAKNCYITPHVAWATKAARGRLLATVVESLAAFLTGQPKNVVNP
jgi:glycerate dehydrogenase